MKRIDNKKNLYKSIILLVILIIGIGYAYLTSNLSITGAAEVVANTWDIHFENLNVTTGSVTASTPASIDSNETSIEYAITLSRPKDFYEFTVDIVNEGTLPGKVSISTLSGLDTTSSKVIDYTIAYTNGNPVNIGDILNAGATKTIKVRVYYKDDIDEDDLPDSNLNLNLTYTLQYVQSEEDEFDTNTLIEQLKTENSSCIYKYTGAVTDEVNNTVSEASNVYYNRCADKRNIKFAGYCWQMIRTTETGGIKMIYNGEPDNNGECGSSRSDHTGIVGADGSTQTLNTEYLYGSSFTYDTTNNNFTLTDTTIATWSDSTYENLIGKFTCKNTTGTCTTLYNVNGYSNNTTAYTSSYTIGDTNYAQIGISSYNANYYSPAMVGYMFNKVYNYKSKTGSSINGTYKFGSTFTYDTNTNTYTLSGTTQDISDWSNGYNTINNTHYTCWNDTGTCSTISYVYYTYYLSSSNQGAYYFDITGGKNVSDILTEMLSSNDVNRYNSSIKGIIDAWYAQNLSSKTNMLEDTVYCNARNINSLGGWNPEGGSTTSGYSIQFKNYTLNNNISCSNETDQFAVSNNKAKLTYPVALATHEELYTLTNNNNSTYYSVLTNTGAWYWGLSPNFFYGIDTYVRRVGSSGNVYNGGSVVYSGGVRFVVSLASGAVITEGDGSTEYPFVISE